MDRIELLFEHHHLGVPSGLNKIIFESVVSWVQTVHLSYIDTNTVSKWTDVRFHMTQVT
jgi:hypothetical protein